MNVDTKIEHIRMIGQPFCTADIVSIQNRPEFKNIYIKADSLEMDVSFKLFSEKIKEAGQMIFDSEVCEECMAVVKNIQAEVKASKIMNRPSNIAKEFAEVVREILNGDSCQIESSTIVKLQNTLERYDRALGADNDYYRIILNKGLTEE